MKISVVIPAHNEEKYLPACLKSLNTQTVAPDEIVVVDNNCTDKTAMTAKQFGARIVREQKKGLTFARNKGFDTARYDIIARCDADTVVPPDWIERIKKRFEDGRIAALSGLGMFYDLYPKTTWFFSVYHVWLKHVLGGHEGLIGPNMALRKTVWHAVRKDVCTDDTLVHEDVDLSIHILQQKGQIAVDRNLTVRVSGRRIRNHPFSFFVEYPKRFLNTLAVHGLLDLRSVAATFISVLLGPVLWPVSILLLLFGSHTKGPAFWLLLLLTVILQVIIPFGYIYFSYRKGRIKDLDITNRRSRIAPLFVFITCFLCSLAAAYMWGNSLFFHLTALMFVLIIVNTAITLFWKISLHMALNVSAALLLNVLFGWRFSVLWLAVPLVFWSRLYLKKHSVGQLAVSFLLNGGIVLLFLRMEHLL